MKQFKIYQASAGSGKTYSLVLEYLALALSDDTGISYRKILGVTFTNKAAGELKERILHALNQLINTDELELRQHLSAQLGISEALVKTRAVKTYQDMLHNYSKLAISTIDRFVQKLIRSFTKELQLNADYEIELDSESIYEETAKMLINQIGRDAHLTKILLDWAFKRLSDNENTNTIYKDLVQFIRSINSEEAIIPLASVLELSEGDFKVGAEKLKTICKSFEAFHSEIVLKVQSHIKTLDLVNANFSNGESGAISVFNEAILKDPLKYAGKFESGHVYNSLDEKGKQTSIFSKDKMKQFGHLKDELQAYLAEHYTKLKTNLIENGPSYNLAKLVQKQLFLLRLAIGAKKTQEQICAASNKLLISDSNKIISAILSTEVAPFIYEIIGERYQHYLIDEFQDTSKLQWENFLPLIDNSLATGGKTLLVGDGKQSIYRFRGGEVEQFLSLCQNNYSASNPEQLYYAESLKRNHSLVNLETNYRSSQHVITFNNALVAKLNTVDGFLNEEFSEVFNKGEQNIHSKTLGYVEVKLWKEDEKASDKKTNTPNSETILEDEDEEDENFGEANLGYIKSTIETLSHKGYSYKECAILVHSGANARKICEFLLANGIPVVSADSLLILQNRSCKLLLACIELLHKPNNQVALAEFLSFAYMANPALSNSFELSQNVCKTKKVKDQKQKYLDCVKAFKAIGIKSDLERLKLLNSYTLCETLAKELGFLTNPNIFIQFFLDESLKFTVKKGSNHIALAKHWRDKQSKLIVSLPSDTNAVQIMTIHKSKGLEFTNVLVPFLNWKSRATKDELWVETNADFTPLTNVLVQNSKKLEQTLAAQVYEKETQRDKLDEANKLYVALTRAKTNLFVFADHQKEKTKMCKVFCEWIEKYQGFNKEAKLLQLGELVSPEKTEEKSSSKQQLTLTELVSEEYMPRLRPSLQAPKWGWDIENPSSERERGNKIHQLLSKIDKFNDIEITIDAAKWEGVLTTQDVDITETITEIVRIGEQENWMGDGLNARNEMELLVFNKVGSHEILRPDRVVFHSNSTFVVDYKTGKPDEKHEDQLNSYISALQAMNFPNVSGKLHYI